MKQMEHFILGIQQHHVPLTPFARNGLSIYLLRRIIKNTPLNLHG